MKKQLTILLTLILVFIPLVLIITSLSNKDSNFPEQKKISPVSFIEEAFNSKTCEEFVSFFDDKLKAGKEWEEYENDIEKCNKKRKEDIEEFNNLNCKEVNKKELNLEYIDLGIDMPIFSDVVCCTDTEDEKLFFFLNYNELEKTYKIVNLGENTEKEIKLKRKEEETKNKEIETRKNTTNPAYLVSPESFVIDEENIISNLPDDNKSVWVEEVVDENTIKVSYIILKGGENIITFAIIDLYGLANIDGCRRNVSTKFLKKFIEYKYVYLSGGYNYFPEKTYPEVPEKFLLKYVRIWKQDVDISIINKLRIDATDNEVEVNTTMVYLGYGMPTRYYSNSFLARVTETDKGYYLDSAESVKLRRIFENIEEVAKVAKRGFWADDVCNGNK